MINNVVIAVDGTAAALSALRWASSLIARDDTPEHPVRAAMLNVWHPTECIGIDGFGLISDADYPSRSEMLLDELTSSVAGEVPRASEIEHVVRKGFTGREILAEADARSADLIVVGTRAQGAIRQALVGSVSQWLAAAKSRVVAVIPAGDHSIGEQTIVGFDDSPAAGQALRWALENCPGVIRAVTVLQPDPPAGAVDDTAERQAASAAGLLGSVLPERLELCVEVGTPIDVLGRRDRSVSQLVVGARSADEGSIWGSVTTHLVAMAPEPVVVVPERVA